MLLAARLEIGGTVGELVPPERRAVALLLLSAKCLMSMRQWGLCPRDSIVLVKVSWSAARQRVVADPWDSMERDFHSRINGAGPSSSLCLLYAKVITSTAFAQRDLTTIYSAIFQ